MNTHNRKTFPYQIPGLEGLEHIKVVKVSWFNGRDSIGIVLVHDTLMDTYTSYIGAIDANDNNEEVYDAGLIAQFGAKVPLGIAKATFPFVDELEEKWKY